MGAGGGVGEGRLVRQIPDKNWSWEEKIVMSGSDKRWSWEEKIAMPEKLAKLGRMEGVAVTTTVALGLAWGMMA
jgi:hypothetical protein